MIPARWPGCRGSSRALAVGTATASHRVPRRCGWGGTSSPPWPPASSSPQTGQFRASRRVLTHGSPISGAVLSLAVLSDGRLASGGRDGTIKLWPKDGAGEPVVLKHGGPVRSLAMLADGRLASGDNSGIKL